MIDLFALLLIACVFMALAMLRQGAKLRRPGQLPHPTIATPKGSRHEN